MLTVHHLAVSQSERIVWLCEELGLQYELKRYERDPYGAAPAAYKALHPAGAAPTITDGGVALAETSAVMAYILAIYGRGRLIVEPASADFADYLFWLHYASGSVMPAAVTALILHSLENREGNAFSRAVIGRLDTSCVMMEQRLAAAPYLGGAEFSAADIAMVFPLTTLNAFLPRDLTPYPHIRGYLDRVTARPAYRAAMKKADPEFPRPFDAP